MSNSTRLFVPCKTVQQFICAKVLKHVLVQMQQLWLFIIVKPLGLLKYNTLIATHKKPMHKCFYIIKYVQ